MLIKPRYYKDCSELPVKVFFKILETRDISLLCYRGKAKNLDVVWDKILDEYEKLTDSKEYTNQLNEANAEVNRVLRINGLINLYYLMTYDPDGDYTENLKFWGVGGSTKEDVKSEISTEKTLYEIRKDKEKALQKLKGKPKSFEWVKAHVEDILGKNYLPTNEVTVKEWVEYCALANEKVKAIKSIANARKSNSE